MLVLCHRRPRQQVIDPSSSRKPPRKGSDLCENDAASSHRHRGCFPFRCATTSNVVSRDPEGDGRRQRRGASKGWRGRGAVPDAPGESSSALSPGPAGDLLEGARPTWSRCPVGWKGSHHPPGGASSWVGTARSSTVRYAGSHRPHRRSLGSLS